MSAPERLRTSDGMVWEHRADSPQGVPLYAEEGALPSCPVFVMATLEELAEHGVRAADLASVVAELGALPVPAGPVSPDAVTRTYMSVASLREDDPNGLRHDYRLSRDLPETGGAS